jgi:hypothetical protein
MSYKETGNVLIFLKIRVTKKLELIQMHREDIIQGISNNHVNKRITYYDRIY